MSWFDPGPCSYARKLAGLVAGVRPTLAVGAVGLGVGPADDGRGNVVRLPKADHQARNERQALLLFLERRGGA